MTTSLKKRNQRAHSNLKALIWLSMFKPRGTEIKLKSSRLTKSLFQAFKKKMIMKSYVTSVIKPTAHRPHKMAMKSKNQYQLR